MIMKIYKLFFGTSNDSAKRRLCYAIACDRSGIAGGIALEITEKIYKIVDGYFFVDDRFSVEADRSGEGKNIIKINIPVNFAKSN